MTDTNTPSDSQPMAAKTRQFRKLTLVCYFALLLWLPVWYFVLSPEQTLSSLFIVLLILPLVLPMAGLIKGKPYTHAWTNFVVMFYLIHGLTSIYAVADEWLYALVELVLATGLFVGCSYYARLRGRELGLGLPKLKDEMAKEKAFFETE